MSRTDWLHTFLAVYRSGSVTEGAVLRRLSQPAASQQLAALERSVGMPLFVRTPGGMEPTPRARSLYLEVAEALDRITQALADLDGVPAPTRRPAVRFGSTAELFSAVVLPRAASLGLAVVAQFGPDTELFAALDRGDLDIALTTSTPPRRSLASHAVGEKRFVLVTSQALAPELPVPSLVDLGQWLAGKPWVTYSNEMAITRRFWQSAFGRPFAGDLRLVAPDLRAVKAAVACGLGTSLLPTFVCHDALRTNRIVELYPVSELVPAEPLFVCTRTGAGGRPHIDAFASSFASTEGVFGA